MLRTCPRDGLDTRADIEDPLIGHVLGDRYRVLERIAAGGAGQVYRVAHMRIAAMFAVKVLYGDLAHDAEMRTRFQREAEAASCLQSRYIVRVVDFGESKEGLPYLAMEHLDGINLSTMIARDRFLPPKRTAAIAKQIARALAHAHERGVVHRDLKTDNIMMVNEDEDDAVVKILDFGLARIQENAKLTGVGQVFGTPHYMAPEQFKGTEVDARADLYALGVILYEMLTGTLPFDGASVNELARQHLSVPPPPIRERNPEVPAKLAALVAQLMAKSPDDRPPSARALLDGTAARKVATPGRRNTLVDVPRLGPVTADLVERIRAAIQLAAPAYNVADYLRCLEVYREAADGVLARTQEVEATAIAARIRTALDRGNAKEPLIAAWEIRYAFDDLLATVPTWQARHEEEFLFEELRLADAIAAHRYAAGHLDMVGDFYLSFATLMSERLRAKGGHPLICSRLDQAVKTAGGVGGGRRALKGLSDALQALRFGKDATETPTALQVDLDDPALEEHARHIQTAISAGVAAYNAGDVVACVRIYRQTATGVIGAIDARGPSAPIAGRLKRALDEAAQVPEDQAVFTLRRAFEDVLSALASERGAPVT
jgi:tRNA A-37 threonylcarbamoyl transferase component Bud32